MATKKEIRGVIVPRHDTAINWSKAVNFTPENGELIIISADNAADVARGYYLDSDGNKLTSVTVNSNGVNKVCAIEPSDKVRFKFGNGKDNVNALPFQTEAIQGTASGSVIQIDDISPVTHEMSVKVSSDTVEDLTAVKVSRCGKNLLDINQAHNSGHENAYDTFSINDNVITATSDNSTTKNVSMALFDGELPAGDYILSLNAVIENTPKHNRPNEILIFKNGSVITVNNSMGKDGSYSKKIKFTLSEKAKINISFYKSILVSQETVSDTVYKVTFSNIQLELGSTATDYEPYKECAEYTPNADGTVNGVTSLYPNTTLMTDTDGVIINCEYLTNNYKPVQNKVIKSYVDTQLVAITTDEIDSICV